VNSEKRKVNSGSGLRSRSLQSKLVRLAFCLSLFTVHCSLFTAVSAQDDDLAPPPLRTVTKDERISLEAQSDVKARTRLALDYINEHLAAAEALNAKHEYDAMFRELGGFQGLVDNTLLYLTAGDKNSKKVLDNLKRFEIGLREFMPRLEAIHRELPLRYEDYVRRLLAYVRNARTKALDPLFSDTVIKKGDK
jgi:hypothetical protein